MQATQKDTVKCCLETAANKYHLNPSQDNLHKIMEAGHSLVCHFARLYAGETPLDDLIQAGYEGLIKAAGRFDPGRQVLFATYASHYIMGEIRHQLRREASFDRPGWLAELQTKIYRVIEEQTDKNGQPPNLDQIAREINIREDGVLQILRAGRVSLGELKLSRITHQHYESFQLTIEDRITLQQAMCRLGELQRKVIYLVFYMDLTQTQAAQELGIGQRRVSRLLKRGLALLNQYLT